MSKLILTRGLPGCGKTTWAREQLNSKVQRVSRDDIRRMLGKYEDFSVERERLVSAIEKAAVQAVIQSGDSALVDDCNLNPKYVAEWRKVAEEHSVRFVIQDFTHVPLRECLKRNAGRQGSERISNKVIHEMHRKWIQPEQQQDVNLDLPKAIICDLDGTLAVVGARSPYDASRCDELDSLNAAVAKVVRKFARDGYQIIFMSGRSSEHREATERFLVKHGFGIVGEPPILLFMRAGGDKRQDAVVKRELYEEKVKADYRVEFCIDDRDQIVDMWRSIGLICFQVGEGWF